MRVRISTTVDEGILQAARALDPSANDASVMERALQALIDRHRAVQIDAAYDAAYSDGPDPVIDAWGDLSSFGDAIRAAERGAHNE